MAQVQQAVHVGVGKVAKELAIGRLLSCRHVMPHVLLLRARQHDSSAVMPHAQLLLGPSGTKAMSHTFSRGIGLEQLLLLPDGLVVLLPRQHVIAPLGAVCALRNALWQVGSGASNRLPQTATGRLVKQQGAPPPHGRPSRLDAPVLIDVLSVSEGPCEV